MTNPHEWLSGKSDLEKIYSPELEYIEDGGVGRAWDWLDYLLLPFALAVVLWGEIKEALDG